MTDGQDDSVVTDDNGIIVGVSRSTNDDAITSQSIPCRAMIDGKVQCGDTVAAVCFEDCIAHHRVMDKRHATPREQVTGSSVDSIPESVAYSQYDSIMSNDNSIVVSVSRSTNSDTVTSESIPYRAVIYCQIQRDSGITTNSIATSKGMRSCIRVIREIRVPPSKRVACCGCGVTRGAVVDNKHKSIRTVGVDTGGGVCDTMPNHAVANSLCCC